MVASVEQEQDRAVRRKTRLLPVGLLPTLPALFWCLSFSFCRRGRF